MLGLNPKAGAVVMKGLGKAAVWHLHTSVIHVQNLMIGLSAIIRNITANGEIHTC